MYVRMAFGRKPGQCPRGDFKARQMGKGPISQICVFLSEIQRLPQKFPQFLFMKQNRFGNLLLTVRKTRRAITEDFQPLHFR